MPRFFRAWLKTLDKKQAKAMWVWFDSDPMAAEKVIDITAPMAGWKPQKNPMAGSLIGTPKPR